MCQFPSDSNSGINEGHIPFDPLSAGKCALPDDYARVPAIDYNVRTANVPACSTSESQIEKHLVSARAKQTEWINSISLLTKQQIFETDNISLSSFHASLQKDLDESCAIISLYEKVTL